MEIPIIILLAMAIAICIAILYNILVSYFKPFFKINDYLLAHKSDNPFRKNIYYLVTDIQRSHNKRYYIKVMVCSIDTLDYIDYTEFIDTYSYRKLLFRLDSYKIYDRKSILEGQNRKLK